MGPALIQVRLSYLLGILILEQFHLTFHTILLSPFLSFCYNPSLYALLYFWCGHYGLVMSEWKEMQIEELGEDNITWAAVTFFFNRKLFENRFDDLDSLQFPVLLFQWPYPPCFLCSSHRSLLIILRSFLLEPFLKPFLLGRSTCVCSPIQAFSSVQSLSCVRIFATPWIAAHQASLSITNSWSSLRLTSIESVMPSSYLILCRPLLLLPPTPPSIRVFSNESALHTRWPKYWSFSFSISPSSEHPGLIFRMDWLDLLAVQGTLKSFLQHHSSKASILWRSASQSISHLHTWPLEKP